MNDNTKKTLSFYEDNPLCFALGISYPVIQGGMAWVADAHLAAAVSNAGGLGVIGSGAMTESRLREEIETIKTLTTKPFGVNLMMMNPEVNRLAQLVVDLEVPVVTTGAGSPGPYIELWKDAGLKVLPVVASTAYAKRMQALGVDALICEGMEAGGHIGELTSMTLIPQVVDAVDCPVIAAGGIADGRGVAAAFMLGAVGVQVGTRFIVADECRASDVYKDKIVAAGDIATIVTGLFGHPVRSLKSPLTRAMAKREREALADSLEEVEAMAAQSLRKAVVDGNWQEGSFMCGQSAGLVTRRESARAIVTSLFSEADALLGQGMTWRRPIKAWSKRYEEDNR